MSTPTLNQFLHEIAQILRTKDGPRLQDVLAVEPPLPPIYHTLATELRQIYPEQKTKPLEEKCETSLPQEDGDTGGSWPAFISFLVQYFSFLRDVNPSHLVDTHEKLKSLLNSCILALSDSSMGSVVLETTIIYSRLLSKLSIGLEKHPELTAALTPRLSSFPDTTSTSASSSGPGTERLTLSESSANTIRDAFRRCLADRSSPSSQPPTGKKRGIYALANLSLKLFAHSHNLRLAEQVFHSIHSSAPPLYLYPAAQRVTYLFYLGHYLLSCSYFYRSFLVLSAAYSQTHRQATHQRGKIATHLILAGVCLGRFATPLFLSRPESQGVRGHVEPLYRAVKLGDLADLRVRLALPHPTATSLLRMRLLFQVRDALEDICFRSLARRAFLLVGHQPAPTSSASASQGQGGSGGSRAAPTVGVNEVAVLVGGLEGRVRGYLEALGEETREVFVGQVFEGEFVDEDLRDDDEEEGVEGLEGGFGVQGSGEGQGGMLRQSIEGPEQVGDGGGPGGGTRGQALHPLYYATESRLASLIHQGLLHGYLSRKHRRFVVLGAKAKGRPAKEVGWPAPWEVFKREGESEGVIADGLLARGVEGWVTEESNGAPGGGGGRGKFGGGVINLKGARPVGQPVG